MGVPQHVSVESGISDRHRGRGNRKLTSAAELGWIERGDPSIRFEINNLASQRVGEPGGIEGRNGPRTDLSLLQSLSKSPNSNADTGNNSETADNDPLRSATLPTVMGF